MANDTLTAEESTLHLPRILCLHGGGTNAQIFKSQCRALEGQLKSEFRLIFAEAPFISQAGPDVRSVYKDWGPFKRWLRWRPEHPDIKPHDATREIDRCLEDAMLKDDSRGAAGEWVALLGFSQGAKVCASLLYRQQICNYILGEQHAAGSNQNYRFGVLLAGRSPLVSLDQDITLDPPLPDASHITTSGENAWSRNNPHILHLPTLHVHGRRDQGLGQHRDLFNNFCSSQSRVLVEWDGDHRVPLKFKDVWFVACQIRALARQTGVLV